MNDEEIFEIAWNEGKYDDDTTPYENIKNIGLLAIKKAREDEQNKFKLIVGNCILNEISINDLYKSLKKLGGKK